MDELNNAHEKARSAVVAVTERQGKIETKVGEVEKEGLPTVPYQPEIDGIAAQAEPGQGGPDARPDRGQVDARRGREARGDAARSGWNRSSSAIARRGRSRPRSRPWATRSPRERSQGLRLDEDGGNPDHPAGPDVPEARRPAQGGARGRSRGRRRASRGGEGAAPASGADPRRRAQGPRVLCQGPARTGPRDPAAPRGDSGQYEAFESELRRDFAPSSWQNVAGNLAQARALLETFDRKIRGGRRRLHADGPEVPAGLAPAGPGQPRSSRRSSSS